MDKLLNAFVDFYRWHSESWLERFQYKEAGHQLLLMALQRILNGGGRIEREMADRQRPHGSGGVLARSGLSH
ncbi:MAG: hypothetical protein IPN20_23565 [Haliscomenobacter sp.]|nr:hypothetical protein [Haliscomenobacter sp.]